MPQKTRIQLQTLFKKGAKPSGDDFKDFVSSVLNISDDGIQKPPGADTPLKILTHGGEENLLDIYTDDTNTWRINQKPDGANPGLNLATSGNSKLFLESASGNLGLGLVRPTAKLHIQQASSQDALRIDDAVNDTTPLIVDTDGKMGLGTNTPERTLHIEVGELRVRASHNNETADIGSFYAKNLTQGIGIGYNRIAAIGSNNNQHILLRPKGSGVVQIAGKLQLLSGYNLEVKNNTLLYTADGKHSWRDNNGANERMVLTTAENGALTVKGTGKSSFGGNLEVGGVLAVKGTGKSSVAGSLGIGIANPGAKLEVSGNSGTLFSVGADADSTANVELTGYIQLREHGTDQVAYLQARSNSSNRDIGMRIRTQKAGKSKPTVRDALTVSPSGNLGIGTHNPGEMLHLASKGSAKILLEADTDNKTETDHAQILLKQDGGTIAGYVGFGGGGNSLTIAHTTKSAESKVVLQTQATDRLVVTSNGKVGIGLSTPGNKLQVVASGGFGSEDNQGKDKGGNVPIVAQGESTLIGMINKYGRQAFALNLNSAEDKKEVRGIPIFYDKYNGNWNECLALRNGRVGLGTNNPGAKLDVNGRILRKGKAFSSSGYVKHGGSVKPPWGTTDDWSIFVSPRELGFEEPKSEGDNALLYIKCWADATKDKKSWTVTALRKFRVSSGSKKTGSWAGGTANYILVPR